MGLSVWFGDAAGAFRLYGGSILSWQNRRKPLAPASGPTLRSGSPPSGIFRGHRGLRLASPSLHLASSATPKGATHLAPTGTSTRPPDVAICGVCTSVHEEQERKQEHKLFEENRSLIDFNFEDPPVQSPPVTCDLRRPSGGVRKGQVRSTLRRSRRTRTVDLAKQVAGRVAPVEHRSEGTRSAA